MVLMPFDVMPMQIDNNKENATKRNRMQQFSIFPHCHLNVVMPPVSRRVSNE